MMLEAILIPIVLRLEANEYAGWLTVARNHELLRGG
jgi:hypothetical protein